MSMFKLLCLVFYFVYIYKIPLFLVTCKGLIRIAIRLRFGFDSTTTKNEHVHFFAESKGVVANQKAVDRAYHDVIVYITVTQMAFTLTEVEALTNLLSD